MRLSVAFMSLLVFAFLALADHLVSAATVAPAVDPAATARVVTVIDASFRIGFGVAAIIATFEIAKLLRRLQHLSRPLVSSNSAPAGTGR